MAIRKSREFQTEVFDRKPLFCIQLNKELGNLDWDQTVEFFKKIERSKAYRDYIKKYYPNGETEKTGLYPIQYFFKHPIPNISLSDIHFSSSDNVEYPITFTNVKGLSSSGQYAFAERRRFDYCGQVSSINDEQRSRGRANSQYIDEYRSMAQQLYLISKRSFFDRIKQVFKPSKVHFPNNYLGNFPSIERDEKTELVLPKAIATGTFYTK